MQVRLATLRLRQRDRPIDAQLRVREVHERVRLLLLQAPVRVDQVRVHSPVLKRLEAVAHTTRHIDRLARVKTRRKHLAEALARPQIHPRAENLTGRDRNVLVPRLRMDAARHALRRVEADVVLHRTEIRQAQRGHLRPLPVLLEPATVVAVHRKVKHQQARDVRLRDLQFLLEFKCHTFPLIPGSPLRGELSGGFCYRGGVGIRARVCRVRKRE